VAKLCNFGVIKMKDIVLSEIERYFQQNWAMGPFVKLDKPVLLPNLDATFECPVTGNVIRWEEQNVYNPAAVVRDEKVYLLYRADDTPRPEGWGRTCRIGLAYSNDGRNFIRIPTPALYPDNDFMKEYEWEGGTEDIHIIEDEAGIYYVNYTAWTGKTDSMCVATSNDLIHWKKHGPAFQKAYDGRYINGSRTGAVVCRREGERLIATRINGKYWMYYTFNCLIAISDNLIDWTPLLDENGHVVAPIKPRDGYFDSGAAEAGAIALLTDQGILVMYNGYNISPDKGGDPSFLEGWSGLGQVLLDTKNPVRMLKRMDKPFVHVVYDWEMSGFISNANVANGLVYFKGEWLLYYGAADRRIGLAVYKP